MGDGISISSVISIMSVTFAVTTVVIGILVRQLLKAYKDQTDTQMKTLKATNLERISNIQKDVDQAIDRQEKALQEIKSGMEKTRDRWERFTKEDAAMEATRGRKVDALFNVVDHMKNEVQQIRPSTFQRLDNLYLRTKQELKAELKEYVREIKTGS